MTNPKTPRMDALCKRIQKILDASNGALSPKHVAEALGKNYTQTYEWIIRQKSVPNGEITLALLEWAQAHEAKPAGKLNAESRKLKRQLETALGKKLKLPAAKPKIAAAKRSAKK